MAGVITGRLFYAKQIYFGVRNHNMKYYKLPSKNVTISIIISRNGSFEVLYE